MVFAVLGAWLALTVGVLAAWRQINSVRAWRVAALLLTLALSLIHQLLFATVAEDAFISFRYSQNIAEGHGAVFNAGERVEGYSNFLWVVLVAIPKTLFGFDIVRTASVLGVLCALACVLAAYFTVNRVVTETPGLGVAAAILTAGATGLAAYGPSGLETPLFVLLALLMCHALAAGRAVVAGVVVALATMTRPDGVVLAVVAGLWLVNAAARGRVTWWWPGGFTLGALVLVVPWTAWRVTYYGHLVPNAVAAKLGGSLGWQLEQGWTYLSSFALVHQGYLLIAVAGVTALLRRRRELTAEEKRGRSAGWLVFALGFAYLLFMTYAGGDWMPAWRLLAPVPVLFAVGAVAAYGVVTGAVPSPRPRTQPVGGKLVPAVALGLCLLSFLVSAMSPSALPLMHEWRGKIAQMEEVGSWLGERLPPGTVISTYANGALSYRAGTQLVVVDVLGLTDEHIAREGHRDETLGPVGHIANDYDYVVNGRRPALAVTTGSGYSDRQRCGADPVYAALYSVATFRREGTDHWIAVYPRAEHAPRLIERLDADPRFTYVPCP
ncbi:hypothetical protein [Amycolatopsis albispora]|uniref:Glycosyltransferase RgtA/B/C/D-like domain-containing protein n=1 Tax=Amycolatopsis albispora TaxID=1804986 RepID=A0A344LCV8_9PSEU|nr:hypothetical protein [Amycolatopsis albispora]AXB45882.1 hypothetical protein A4R43_28195 [Amycolatopsis albispora]